MNSLEERFKHTIVASLKFYKSRFIETNLSWKDGEELKAIASNGGQLEPLTSDEVDLLCNSIMAKTCRVTIGPNNEEAQDQNSTKKSYAAG